MSAKLVAYEHVPIGFEMVINNPDVEMGRFGTSGGTPS